MSERLSATQMRLLIRIGTDTEENASEEEYNEVDACVEAGWLLYYDGWNLTREGLDALLAEIDRLRAEAEALRKGPSVEVVAQMLRARADLYEKDGKPGELGYNFWGWRDFAAEMRRIAKEIEAR